MAGQNIFVLIRGAQVYTPWSLGVKDVLLAGNKIAFIDDGIRLPRKLGGEVINGKGLNLVPGFIDSHVHILGGGGEGGFKTRTPEIFLSQLINAGTTAVVGCLGTDAATRTMSNLVAKARGLTDEGISCYCYTGNYRIPVTTLTGSVIEDLVHIDRIIGVGEIALSDHRSSQPTFNELARLAADARVGGLLSGKAGVINVHMGAGKRKLDLLKKIVSETEIPTEQFLLTHVGRTAALLESAIQWAGEGGNIDLTTSSPQQIGQDKICGAATGLSYLLEKGVAIERIGFSSDAQGSLPVFDEHGNFSRLGVGKASTLHAEFKKAILEEGIAVQDALQVITANPARFLKLENKGGIAVGADADLLLLDRNYDIDTVIAAGKILMRRSKLLVKGTFEND